ncbi:hypothetical protein [Paenibacillus antarcticus]|uniref:PilZ domain-containing protein n=1 Tax=Paenibacillus antarcticus TaxID=253703 RepID=A0A168R3D0_9BACL|nr:hypothetical protein [Paenibacillus antarcticus]OAB48534.1 hypothetical protein PBAT_02565 [Paenibacillus antarcticus]
MNSNVNDWANLTLKAHIYIREVRGNKVNSKRRPIFLMELGNNSLCFLSDLDLPMINNVVFGFDIEDSSSKVKLSGKIEAKGLYENMFQYRVKLPDIKEHKLYNMSLLKKMLINLNYFLITKNKHGIHRNINLSI